MIKLNKLTKTGKRLGRGISAGQGKTSGRGTKGQNSRSGHKRYRGFTSGSLQYAQRLPKFSGIKSAKNKYTVTTTQIDEQDELKEKTVINREWLIKTGLIPALVKKSDTVKIVNKGKQKQSYKLGEDVLSSKTVKTT